MKYEVYIYRNEGKDIEVDAENRDDAIRLAREQNPGFQADTVVDAFGGEHTAITGCENCGKTIWEGEKYATDPEGIDLCMPCSGVLSKEPK